MMKSAALTLVLACCMSITGCTKSTENVTTGGPSTGVSAKVIEPDSTLMQQIGGMARALELAEAFGTQLSASEPIGKYLDPLSIAQAKNALVNEIAKVSGYAPPHPGPDLVTVLSGRGIDVEGASALAAALSTAADQVNLGDAQKVAVMALLGPVKTSLLNNR